MAPFSKVAWFEGMNLDPHHFQQLDRYHHSELNFRIRALHQNDWGFIELALDKDKLTNGQFYLNRCQGVTQDGLVFSMPDHVPSPAPRNIQDFFPATEEKIKAYLAVPAERADGENCILEGTSSKGPVRFNTKTIKAKDDNAGGDEREIVTAQPVFSVRFSTENLENYITLPITEINRTPDGRFSVNDKFIPPCLSLETSERLLAITNGILEQLISCRVSLLEERQAQASDQTELTHAKLINFWFLSTVNCYIPLVNHYFSGGYAHPESFYLLLVGLTGQISTFYNEQGFHPRNLPHYDHGQPSQCFNQLETILRRYLTRASLPQKYVLIPLEKKGDTVYVGRIDNQALLTDATFFLICRSDKPTRKIIEELPRMVKIAALDEIENLEKFALSGLTISHTTHLPPGIPTQPDSHYFHLDSSGVFWDAICKSSTLAIRLHPGYTDIHLELMAFKP